MNFSVNNDESQSQTRISGFKRRRISMEVVHRARSMIKEGTREALLSLHQGRVTEAMTDLEHILFQNDKLVQSYRKSVVQNQILPPRSPAPISASTSRLSPLWKRRKLIRFAKEDFICERANPHVDRTSYPLSFPSRAEFLLLKALSFNPDINEE